MIESNGKNYLTWDEIQEKHGISRRTLERWLENLADEKGRNVISSLIRGHWCLPLGDYRELVASRAGKRTRHRARASA